jgi:ketosteroid isomerase-like protein
MLSLTEAGSLCNPYRLEDRLMSTSRRSLLAATAPAIATAAGLAPEVAARGAYAPAQTRTDPVVRDLTERATQAHAALMRGDVASYRALITQASDFTLMSPFGGEPTRGAPDTNERWASIGRFFRSGRESSLELVEAYRAGDMVVLAAIERTHVEVGGLAGQHWTLRVTLVFRKDGDEWRQVHRHADPLAPGISLEQAAALARGRG